jgi:Cdc6-like AAA superfamily ATPase
MNVNEVKYAEIESRWFCPEKIIGREKEKKQLEEWTKDVFTTPLITSYEAGTGKTTTVKWFLDNKLSDFIPIYILCRETGTTNSTLKHITDLLIGKTGMKFVGSRKVNSDMYKYLREVLLSGKKIIICLDELDALIEKENNDDLLNMLLHIKLETPQGKLGLILISNDYRISSKFSQITNSRLREISMLFGKYGIDEAIKILIYYMRDYGIVENLIPKDENSKEFAKKKRMIFDFVRQMDSGDIRKILGSFITWVKKCDKELDMNVLTENFFDEIAKKDCTAILRECNKDEQLIILALIKSEIDLKDKNDTSFTGKKYSKHHLYTTHERLYRYYEGISNKIGHKPLSLRRFRDLTNYLEKRKKIIDSWKRGLGRGKGTIGYYVLDDVMKDYFETIVAILTENLNISPDYIFGVDCSHLVVNR